MPILTQENHIWSATCSDDGLITITNKMNNEESFQLNLFGDDFNYRYIQWDVVPGIYILPDSEYIIITYGIGYVYFVSTAEKKVVKSYKLFRGFSYEDDSYKNIFMCCYYSPITRVDMSSTGRYVVIRVRGDYDPQDADGREFLTTPVYFRSCFIIDMQTLDIIIEESFDDVPENSGRNVAAIAFSPHDEYFVVGALGNAVKVFNLRERKCIGELDNIVWIPMPLDIQHCPLIAFLDEKNFVYVNKDNNIVRYSLDDHHGLVKSGILYTNIPDRVEVSKGVYSKWSYIEEIQLNDNQIICHIAGNRKELNGPTNYELEFEP